MPDHPTIKAIYDAEQREREAALHSPEGDAAHHHRLRRETMRDPIQDLRRLTERATPGTVIYFGGHRVELDGTCAFMHGGVFFGATALEGPRKGGRLDISERIVANALDRAEVRS